MVFRTEWRDAKGWQATTKGSIQLNTTSNDAIKYYDAIVTQLLGWYEDSTLNGLDGSIESMVKADPNFLLGQCLNVEIQLSGLVALPKYDPELAKSIDKLNKLAKSKGDLASELELLHVDAINKWATGNLKKTVAAYDKIATLYPEDVFSVKMAADLYYFLGEFANLRNICGFAKSSLAKQDPWLGFVHGMYSFGLEECHQYERAQQEGLIALEYNPKDTWAIHNVAHCYEMKGAHEDGRKWLQDKQNDWIDCDFLASHQWWHLALFTQNTGSYAEAVAIYDSEILPRFESTFSCLNLHDAASMQYRMELIDLHQLIEPSKDSKARDEQNHKRWSPIYKTCKPHSRGHIAGFNDVHYMMSYLGHGDMQLARELIDSCDDVEHLYEGQSIVKPLLEAMYQYKMGDYKKVVELLQPIRYDLVRLGGSNAQRDVFDHLLLVSAYKTKQDEWVKYADRMCVERDAIHQKRIIATDLLARQKSSKV